MHCRGSGELAAPQNSVLTAAAYCCIPTPPTSSVVLLQGEGRSGEFPSSALHGSGITLGCSQGTWMEADPMTGRLRHHTSMTTVAQIPAAVSLLQRRNYPSPSRRGTSHAAHPAGARPSRYRSVITSTIARNRCQSRPGNRRHHAGPRKAHPPLATTTARAAANGSHIARLQLPDPLQQSWIRHALRRARCRRP